MILAHGNCYELWINHKNGWNAERFRERFNDVLERYDYVVGDWGHNQLRLRGFFKPNGPKVTKETSIDSLQDYLHEYCNFGCAYFVLTKLPQKHPYERPKLRPDEFDVEWEETLRKQAQAKAVAQGKPIPPLKPVQVQNKSNHNPNHNGHAQQGQANHNRHHGSNQGKHVPSHQGSAQQHSNAGQANRERRPSNGVTSANQFQSQAQGQQATIDQRPREQKERREQHRRPAPHDVEVQANENRDQKPRSRDRNRHRHQRRREREGGEVQS